MLSPWSLPRKAVLGGKEYPIHCDFRDILEIIDYLDSPELPEFIRWQVALALFYEDPIPGELQEAAMDFLARFLVGGRPELDTPGPRYLYWQQDAPAIISDVNRVAGQEIRALPFLHWWTFLSWFHGIGEGQVSTLVHLREKLRRGKPLEDWEKEYYRLHRRQIQPPKPLSQEEKQEQQRLLNLLDGKKETESR